jgi:hypothetical protein
MKKIFAIIFCLTTLGLSSQCIATYVDMTNQAFIVDAGESKYLESLPLLSYKIGRNNMMAYIANNGRLKIYFKGKVYLVTDNSANYYMTDNWFLYQNFNLIKLLYKDEWKTLDSQFEPGADSLFYSDSVVVWTNALGELNAFYNGKTTLLERTDIHGQKIGTNIFAYMDEANNLKVFYRGEVQTLESYQPSSYSVNQNLLVYFDQYNNLKIFHDGILDETSTPAPAEYRLGKDFFAYISQLRQLVVYYKGQETVLMDDRPTKWTVRKNMMVYTDKGNNFWCWYNGKNYWLERYIPLSYKVDNDIVVYQDLDGRLKAFYYGEQVEVSDQIVTSYNLFNEAVTYQLYPYETTVWCNKKSQVFK